MLRSGASRGLLRSLNAASTPVSKVTRTALGQQFRSQLCTVSRRPQLVSAVKPLASHTLALARWQSGSGSRKPVDNIDTQHETEAAKEKLEVHPDLVSASSSTRGVMSEVGAGTAKRSDEDSGEMLAGVKSDLQTIRDTFSLADVPREAYYVGMAGVLPYMATSLSTVYCSWEISHAHESGTGLFLSDKTAELLLHVIEPLQVGYGAVIISFLGAIHWGLEWAGYGGHQGYPRYMIGVVSTALAWPTILLPVEYALISQFLIFNFLYYTDSRATKRGWAPAWYGVYRFVLTFIVGSAIVISLIGRGQVADRIGKLPGPADRVKQLRAAQQEQLEEEEEARRGFLASKDEEEDDE